MGYTLNIGGSLVGIAVFLAHLARLRRRRDLVLRQRAGIAYLLRQVGGLTWFRGLTLGCWSGAWRTPGVTARARHHNFWSPYYAVDYTKSDSAIKVNNIGHQAMIPSIKLADHPIR